MGGLTGHLPNGVELAPKDVLYSQSSAFEETTLTPRSFREGMSRQSPQLELQAQLDQGLPSTHIYTPSQGTG